MLSEEKLVLETQLRLFLGKVSRLFWSEELGHDDVESLAEKLESSTKSVDIMHSELLGTIYCAIFYASVVALYFRSLF